MVEIVFKGQSIQKGDRIKIPPAIMDTLDLSPGDSVVLLFDAEEKKFVVKLDRKVRKRKK